MVDDSWLTTDEELKSLTEKLSGAKAYFENRSNQINYTNDAFLSVILAVKQKLNEAGITRIQTIKVREIKPSQSNIIESFNRRKAQFGPPVVEVKLTIPRASKKGRDISIQDVESCIALLYDAGLDPIEQSRWVPIQGTDNTFIDLIFFYMGRSALKPLTISEIPTPHESRSSRLPNLQWCPKCGKYVGAVPTPDGGTLMCPYCFYIFGKRSPKSFREKIRDKLKGGWTTGKEKYAGYKPSIVAYASRIMIMFFGLFLFTWELITFGGGAYGGQYWIFAIFGIILGFTSFVFSYIEEKMKAEEKKETLENIEKKVKEKTIDEKNEEESGQIWNRILDKE